MRVLYNLLLNDPRLLFIIHLASYNQTYINYLVGLEIVKVLILSESEVLSPLRSHLSNMRATLNKKVDNIREKSIMSFMKRKKDIFFLKIK